MSVTKKNAKHAKILKKLGPERAAKVKNNAIKLYAERMLGPQAAALERVAAKARNDVMRSPEYLRIEQEAGQDFEQKLEELRDAAANVAREERRARQLKSREKHMEEDMRKYEMKEVTKSS